MSDPAPCGQICTQNCATPCSAISLGEALARFKREACQGVCDTGRYRCRYSTWGEGPPLLFIHGLADISAGYVLPRALLAPSFRTIAYELPSGREDGACLKRYTHASLVEDLWALLDHVG